MRNNNSEIVRLFTFHNVSINSSFLLGKRMDYFYLHSIMYLLIRQSFLLILLLITFTFHNVSINSPYTLNAIPVASKFTFHNVSINSSGMFYTECDNHHLHSIMYLLIQKFIDNRRLSCII